MNQIFEDSHSIYDTKKGEVTLDITNDRVEKNIIFISVVVENKVASINFIKVANHYIRVSIKRGKGRYKNSSQLWKNLSNISKCREVGSFGTPDLE